MGAHSVGSGRLAITRRGTDGNGAGRPASAACYGGHQFGAWAGQLGDGRAINPGEVINRAGRRWALQLKGAGPTAYARRADGRAVLRSAVREFLRSEAMHHLGVPTTRALSLVSTGETVVRDMFYDGNLREEPGAVVCRVRPPCLPIPDWARWLAQDEDGAWWAYEAEPNRQHNGWYENEVGRLQRLVRGDPPVDRRARLIRIAQGEPDTR